MSRLRIYPGTCGCSPQRKKSHGTIPMMALLIIFGVITLFSMLAFFISLLALAK